MLTYPNDVVYEIVGSCHSVDRQVLPYEEPALKGLKDIGSASLTTTLAKIGITSTEDGMLSNGGRLYNDISGLEYATPETSSAQEAVYRTFDGDEIVLKVLKQLEDDGALKGFQLNRRIVDHNRASRGVHLNTLTSIHNNPGNNVNNWLATLNLAKGSLFGSGGLLVDEHGVTSFHHSPRLSITNSFQKSGGGYTQKALVRSPFKPDTVPFSRVETVSSDALNFAWPIRASLVATNAVIGLIEMGYGKMLPTIDVSQAKASAERVGQFGYDGMISLSRIGESRRVSASALEVLRRIGEILLDIDSVEQQLDAESHQVVGEIIDVADRMEADPYSVANQVESMGRLVAMERKMAKNHLAIGSERLCRFDYAWDWLGGGIAERFRDRGIGWQGFDKGPSAPSITKKRLVTPPQDTRAKLRGQQIAQGQFTGRAEWYVVNFGPKQVHIPPLQTELTSV
jgi:hypothetical protein